MTIDNMMPELTLDPRYRCRRRSGCARADADAPTAPEVPQAEEKKIEPVEMDESLLTEEERKAVDEFSQKIDITRHQHGAAVRRRRPEEHRGFLRERPEQRPHQGSGRGRAMALSRSGGGAEGLRRGARRRRGCMGLFKKAGNGWRS